MRSIDLRQFRCRENSWLAMHFVIRIIHPGRFHDPLLAVAVVRGADVVWSTGVGWANREEGIHAGPDTVYMLASVSKTVTCAPTAPGARA